MFRSKTAKSKTWRCPWGCRVLAGVQSSCVVRSRWRQELSCECKRKKREEWEGTRKEQRGDRREKETKFEKRKQHFVKHDETVWDVCTTGTNAEPRSGCHQVLEDVQEDSKPQERVDAKREE